MKFLVSYLVLPSTITEFEDQYLRRMNRVAFYFFMCHVPCMALLAYLNDTGPGLAGLLTTATVAGPLLAMQSLTSRRSASMVMGVAAMLMGGLLVHFGQGPVQIEMHFYFFVLLALLAVFGNPMVIISAAVTVALHHGLMWCFLPASVFNYAAPFWVVGIHAAFVVLESVAACFIARSFFDNVIGLEKIVATRTNQLESRNNDMRMLLDSVQQGFFTINSTGMMSEERSTAVEKLFGKIDPRATFAEVLSNHDFAVGEWFAGTLNEVFAEIMPVDVALDQLPKRCVANGRSLSLNYTPIYTAGHLIAVLTVVVDVTAEVEHEKMDSQNRQFMAMVDRIAHDKAGFLDFFHEAESIVDNLRNASGEKQNVVKRLVHTLKGNSAILDLHSVADACHAIEGYIAEQGQLPEQSVWAELFYRWEDIRCNLNRLIGQTTTGITLNDAEYDIVLQGILNNAPRDAVATRVATWRLEPTSRRMRLLAEHATILGRQLGKGEVGIIMRGGNLRIEPGRWHKFWNSLIHVIRNAMDHGLESPVERLAAGKTGAGTIEISTAIDGGRFVISLSDDGRGIDWTRVADAASRNGIASQTPEDLVNALFADVLTTSDQLSSTGVRDAGMAVVKASCDALDGRVAIISTVGKGTTFSFDFPLEMMAPETTELLVLNEINEMRDLLVDNSVSALTTVPF